MSDENNPEDKKGDGKPTLTDDQITSKPMTRRRAMFGAVTGAGAVAAGAAALGTSRPAQAQVTDADGGPFADPAGQGRGGVRTGLTDADGGQWADPPGGGRWGSGLTDSDYGPYFTDQAGNGRRGF